MQKEVARVVQPFLEAADAVLPKGYSALLYGSAARDEFVPGRSDVNLMLVPDHVDPTVMAALSAALQDWELEKQPPPLLLSREELRQGTDVFPIEITDIKVAYQVLRGEDPVAGLAVKPSDLRRALERELRGKQLRLRQAYAAFREKPEMLGPVAQGSIAVILVLFRSVLCLLEQPVPDTSPATVRVASEALGVDGELLGDILKHRAEEDWSMDRERFEQYMTAVAQVVRKVDEHKHPGDPI